MLIKYKPYSCDCSSWNSAQQYGQCRIYLGKGSWDTWTVERAQKEHISQRIIDILKQNNFSVEQFRNPLCWQSRKSKGMGHDQYVSLHLSIDSWVRYAKEFRSVFGTRIFLASIPTWIPALFQGVDRIYK